ncbi:CD1290 family small acid-soluble spore protein [Romboutsia sp.]|uniref:CD1290 family small acid-soluble spore protein n=1 Tax=Romboutsia sp. TaxID=1965302 RepID=UPI003F36BF8B
MSNVQSNHNAKMALKQMRMEVAADYGMSSEDIFDILEHAHNNGILREKTNHSPIRKKSVSRKPSHLE